MLVEIKYRFVVNKKRIKNITFKKEKPPTNIIA